MMTALFLNVPNIQIITIAARRTPYYTPITSRVEYMLSTIFGHKDFITPNDRGLAAEFAEGDIRRISSHYESDGDG